MASVRQRSQPHRELFALRVNEGLSRRALSLRTGISAETIRQAELGLAIPNPDTQKAIASAFSRRPLDLWPLERQRLGT